MKQPLDLPHVNYFSDPNTLQTLWNFISAIFPIGMPVLLITVAILCVGLVLELIPAGALLAKKSKRDDDEDDDW